MITATDIARMTAQSVLSATVKRIPEKSFYTIGLITLDRQILTLCGSTTPDTVSLLNTAEDQLNDYGNRKSMLISSYTGIDVPDSLTGVRQTIYFRDGWRIDIPGVQMAYVTGPIILPKYVPDDIIPVSPAQPSYVAGIWD